MLKYVIFLSKNFHILLQQIWEKHFNSCEKFVVIMVVDHNIIGNSQKPYLSLIYSKKILVNASLGWVKNLKNRHGIGRLKNVQKKISIKEQIQKNSPLKSKKKYESIAGQAWPYVTLHHSI